MAWGDSDKVAAPAAGATWGANDHVVAHPGFLATAIDAGRGYLKGLEETGGQLVDNIANVAIPGLSMIKTSANLGRMLANKITGTKSAPVPSIPTGADIANLDAYEPQTTAGKYGKAFGQNTLNLMAPGSAAARMVNVALPAVSGESAAEFAHSLGASPKWEAGARFVGGMIGAGGASMRPQHLGAETNPVGMMTGRAPQDPAAMAQRAQEYRDVGMSPTPADVVDDSGRGMIRAAANRMTPARTDANQFATGRALDLPSRIGGQARRVMSSDTRTPDEIRAAMSQQRSTNADAAFGAVRGDVIPLAPETVQALRTDYGKSAIAEAASREQDPEIRAALNRLHGDALDNPGQTQITIGMADRISRVLNGQATKAARAGDHDLASSLGNLGRSIRQPAATASPGYKTALEGYGADSKLQQAAGVGEGLMTRNTDEFVSQAKGLGGDERALALAAGRRAVERRAGETIGGAPNIAMTLADAPEQQARNAALMGADKATDFQNGMRLEAKAVDNGRMIQPRAGASTYLNAADANVADKVAGAAKLFRQGATHDWLGMGVDWLKSRGLSDDDAAKLVRLSIDPAQTDEVIRQVSERLGNSEGRKFLSMRNAALIGAISATTGAAPVPEHVRAQAQQ